MRKITPITVDFVWWHLIYFFYTSNQREEELIIEIVKKQIEGNLKCGPYSNADLSYIGFFKEPLNGRSLGFSHISKMLNLATSLLESLKDCLESHFESQPQELLWRTHCEALAEGICTLFSQESQASDYFAENMICILLYLASLLEKSGLKE